MAAAYPEGPQSVEHGGWIYSAIPYVFATVGMLAWAAIVSRTGRKILNLVLALALAAAGLALSVIFPALIPAIIALSVALVGTISARTIF